MLRFVCLVVGIKKKQMVVFNGDESHGRKSTIALNKKCEFHVDLKLDKI